MTLPSWRLDLEREIDLIEEVARVYGYNRFANTLPAFAGSIRMLPNVGAEAVLRRKLLASGFHEAISNTFCGAQDAALTAPQPGLAVPLGNPLSEEAGMMRPSLIPGMLHMVAGNLHRDVEDVRLFEVGTVFSGTTDRVDERPALSFGAAGAAPQAGPMQLERALDFYDIKGLVEQIVASFRTKSVIIDTFPAEAGLTPAWLHPYRSARVSADGLTVGWFGQIHPKLAAERKLKAPVFVGELYLDRLFALPLAKPAVRELSRFQPVRRDFSFHASPGLTWSRIDESLAALATKTVPELIDWRVREIRQEPGGGSEYALLLGATFQAPDRTLRDQELQAWSTQIVETVSALGARLRT